MLVTDGSSLKGSAMEGTTTLLCLSVKPDVYISYCVQTACCLHTKNALQNTL